MKNSYCSLLLSLFLVACASSQLSPKVIQSLDSTQLEVLLNAKCLSSQGRGRLLFAGQHSNFTYESSYRENEGEHQWVMEMDYAFHSSQVLLIQWFQSMPHTSWGGSFRQRLDDNGLSELSQKWGVDEFTIMLHLQSLSAGVRWLLEGQRDCQKIQTGQLECKVIEGEYKLSYFGDSLEVLVSEEGHLSSKIELGHYQKDELPIRYKLQIEDRQGQALMVVDFVASQCR